MRRDGVRVSRKRVARLMGTAGLHGAFVRKRWRASTRQDSRATPAPDLVGRNFKVGEPNRLWVADISRIPTGEGPLWLASVRDAIAAALNGRPRKTLGWRTPAEALNELLSNPQAAGGVATTP